MAHRVKREDLRDIFQRNGWTILELRRNGHWHITASISGKRRKFTAPFSPSDHRSMINFEHQVRRAGRAVRT